MDLNLTDKVVFVAGGSRGIGFGIAQAFLREGAKVGISSRGEQSLEIARAALAEIAGEGRVFAITGDMTKSADISAALDGTIAALGELSIVVANVGIGLKDFRWDVTDEEWNGDIAQNFTGSMFVAREAIRRFAAGPETLRKGANVVVISSIAGIDAIPAPIPYGASKAALNYATAILAKAVANRGIRVNAIAPGNIIFPGGDWEKRWHEENDLIQRYLKNEVAMQRFGTVQEIADAALWLSSERASFVTGTTLVVDGGQVRSFG